MTDTTAVYAEIVKHERNADGDLVVYGRATGPDLDLDKQICDPGWLKQAMPEWFTSGANLREQHSSIAAGVGQEIVEKPDGGWDLKALVVDSNSARKVERGVLKGYSIGIRSPKVVKDAAAPGGRIVGGSVCEVSLVDRPANETCRLILAKALKPGPMTVAPGTVDHERHLVKVEELHEDPAAAIDRDLEEFGLEIEKRDFSQGERREAAGHSQAMSDGSFPIKNAKDLANAIRLAGNAKDPAKAKAHIKRRAAALGLSDRIPDTWKAANADEPSATFEDVVEGLDLGAVRKALEWFIEQKEPGMAHVESADPPATEKAAAPDAAQTETPAPVAEKAAEGEEKTDLTELVKALTAKVDGLEGQLTKAMNAPAPGGPVLTRTTEDTAKAAVRETRLTKAAEYDRLADEVRDPQARAGYLQLAAQERGAAATS